MCLGPASRATAKIATARGALETVAMTHMAKTNPRPVLPALECRWCCYRAVAGDEIVWRIVATGLSRLESAAFILQY